jgi:Na+/H+ antiporter NhaD/arsenite permease-like protein
VDIPLFWGVNIGGNGTIIASLANWIAVRRLPTGGIKEFMKISGLFLLITLIIGLVVFF